MSPESVPSDEFEELKARLNHEIERNQNLQKLNDGVVERLMNQIAELTKEFDEKRARAIDREKQRSKREITMRDTALREAEDYAQVANDGLSESLLEFHSLQEEFDLLQGEHASLMEEHQQLIEYIKKLPSKVVTAPKTQAN